MIDNTVVCFRGWGCCCGCLGGVAEGISEDCCSMLSASHKGALKHPPIGNQMANKQHTTNVRYH